MPFHKQALTTFDLASASSLRTLCVHRCTLTIALDVKVDFTMYYVMVACLQVLFTGSIAFNLDPVNPDTRHVYLDLVAPA